MDFDACYGMARREWRRGVAEIREFERGVFYRKGVYQRTLTPGRYRIWPFTAGRIVAVDMRRSILTISNQKLLTSDQVTVTVNVTAGYEVSDPVAALHRVESYEGQLHLDLQMAAREVIGNATVDDLLADRGPLAAGMLAAVAPMAEGYGVRVLSTGIKDIIFAPRVRDLLLKEVEAKRLAHAALIGAREEVAAMRALLNAARLAEEHPQLLRLRELEVARSAVQAGAATVMLGAPSGPVTPLPKRSADDAPPVDQTADNEPDE